MLEKLQREFHKDMANIYSEADKQLGYKAAHFLRMLSEQGGYKTAIKLVSQPKEEKREHTCRNAYLYLCQ